MSTAWDQALIFAAAARARVRTVDGKEGVLVYAPGTHASQGRDHKLRHGDRAMCGVRFDDNSHRVTAVDPKDITEVIRSGPTQADDPRRGGG